MPQQVQLENNSTKDSGNKTKCMDQEPIIIQTEQYIKGNGEVINIMVKELTNFLMAPSIKGNGSITSCTGLDILWIILAESGEVSLEKEGFKQKIKRNLSKKKQ